MKMIYVFLIVLCSINLIYGQTFTEIEAGLPGVSDGTTAWGDYDNDGDLDILLTGNIGSKRISKIYRNDDGIFTDINAILIGIDQSSIALGDFDNDSDLDILLTGYTGIENISRIYRNDSGKFVHINAGLPGVENGSVDWGDYDNDGDLDILLTGYSNRDIISTIYRNDSGIFTDINAGLPVVSSSSVAWGDYDSDGDLDILLSGLSGVYKISKIFRNDSGVFTDINAGLTGVENGSVAWGDYDNDGDLDILLTGWSISPYYISRIYRNDGENIFTDINAGLTGLDWSSVDWGDYDNDGDLDILLSGDTGSGFISRVYRNDSGIFTDINAGLTGVENGSVAWGDYDNDGDLDVIITGEDKNYVRIAKIYQNNSLKANTKPNSPSNLTTFLKDSTVILTWEKATDNETPSDGLSYNLYLGIQPHTGNLNTPMSDTVTGYRQVVKLGNAQQNTSYTLNKTLPNGKYFWSVQAIDHAFAGSEFAPEMSFIFSNPLSPVAEAASNITTTSFKANWGEVPEADGYCIDVAKDESFTNYVPGYNNLDVGDTLSCVVENLALFTEYFYRVRAYKINSSTSLNSNVIQVKTLWEQFTDIDAGLLGISDSSVSWGDYDNDGDLDFLMTGYSMTDPYYFCKICRNDDSLFTDINAGIAGVRYGEAAWGDYDNDGDLDIAVSGRGWGYSNYISKIYRNDNGVFNDIDADLTGVDYGTADWGDYDNDGDLDLIITGQSYDSKPVLYKNNNGVFRKEIIFPLAMADCCAAWGDYDNDGDLDLLFSSLAYFRLYRNDNQQFVMVNNSLANLSMSSADWGDYDNDGDLDLVLIGYDGITPGLSKIYRNDNGEFVDINAGLIGVYSGTVSWGDYDNDGDIDLLLTGYAGGDIRITKIYRNDNNIFTDAGISLPQLMSGSAAWGDYDNDGDLDILISGSSATEGRIARIFRNNTAIPNPRPENPANLTTSYNDSTITFSWDKATDNETPQDGLSYNFYLGTESLQGDLKTSMSDNSTGYRKVVQLGNAQKNTSYTLNKALPIGLYYWSVQAIDHAFAGSDFASEKSFVILSSPQNVQIKHKDDLLKLTWDEVPGAQMYYVYASDDPESEFINVSKQGIFNGTTWTQTISSVKKFYYVVAVIK